MLETCLVTAFDGEDNSSRIICKKLKADCKKIILPNHKTASCEMLKKELDDGFRYVFSLGQKTLIKNKISVEDTAKLNGKILKSNAESVSEIIKKFGYDCYVSHNAGTSFCNNLYYFGLDHIAENQIKTNMFFLHVPFAENCNMDAVAEVLDKSINYFRNKLEQCL